MENGKKDILLHLYSEETSGSDLRTLLKDEELKSEYTELSEVKFRLDHMGKSRPDVATIDRVLAASAMESGLPGHSLRTDRPAIARATRLRKVLIPALSLAAAIVFGIGIGIYGTTNDAALSDSVVSTAEAPQNDLVPAESLNQFIPRNQTGLSRVSTMDPRLAWDDASTIQKLHRRMETMRPTDRLDWGERAVPLESLPGSNQRRFQTTGSNN